MSPHDKVELALLWLAALTVFGAAFAVPGWLRFPMIVTSVVLAGFGTFALLSLGDQASKKPDSVITPSPTPVVRPSPAPPAPTPKSTPSPAPTSKPTPTATPTVAMTPHFVPKRNHVEQNEEYSTPAPEDYYDYNTPQLGFYVELRNETRTSFAVDVYRDGTWRDEYEIAAGDTVIIEGESARVRVRLCDCETVSKAADAWTLTSWENDGSNAPSYTFYVNKARQVNLRITKR